MATERDGIVRAGSPTGYPTALGTTHDTVALGGYRVLWVTRPAVLERIANWGAGRRARSQATDVDRRLAIGAATALAETIQGALTGLHIPWERTLGVDTAELAQRMGASLAEGATGLDWLVRTGAMVAQGGGGAQFLIPEDLWTPAPALAAIAWPDVRQQLSDRGGRLAPALAVLRALAERPEAIRAAVYAAREAEDKASDDGSDEASSAARWGKTSVAHLVNSTLFGRSAVLDALGRLEATGMIARRRFPGSHEGDEVQLLPTAFGQTNSVSSPVMELPAASSSGASSITSAAPAPIHHGVQKIQQPAPQSARQVRAQSAQDLVQMTIAGITLRVPLGTTVTITTDEAGSRVIHVGDDIVIGPLT